MAEATKKRITPINVTQVEKSQICITKARKNGGIQPFWPMMVKTVENIKIDCLPNIVRSVNPLVSIVWLALLLSSACCCFLLVRNTMEQFYAHEVTTTVRLMFESKALFPTITFCNKNPFTSASAVKLLKQAGLLDQLRGNAKDNFNTYLRLEAYLNETRGYTLTYGERKRLTDLDDMLVGCTFQVGHTSPRNTTNTYTVKSGS